MERKEKRGELRERLCRRLDLVPDLFSGEGLVELRGRGAATVRGGGRILLYTPSEIRIAMGKYTLSIVGEELVCTSYYQGAVGVDGRIFGVSFEEGEE
ncbi:MAG: YabP/YqfC family sporulation protein [Clostridia bacterium]|nr:YabP/YqfC family sporulation protein [Clostridia bacterium]